jgi:uncharacterized protein YlxW (UPF0749 family)
MKNNEASLFVFIASIIIGILISLNINFNRTYNRVFLTTKQYQDAYNQRNKLRNDLGTMKDNYEELYDKLRKFELGGKNTNNVVQEIQNELDMNKMILGQADVEGQGIMITLKDISNDLFYNDDDPNILDKIIHNYDITYVINDLRNAGAEAISINGQRIIDRSEVICDGALLKINGVKIASPFYINAIGNKEILKKYMLTDENYLKFMDSRSIFVEVKELDNVKIQAYNHNMTKEYIESVKNK